MLTLIFYSQDPSYGFCDLGGAYVCETQTKLLKLAKQLGVETYKVFGKGQTVEDFLVGLSHCCSSMIIIISI